MSEPGYLPAAGFGEPFRFTSPEAELWSGEQVFLPLQPLDWLGIAPAMVGNISGPVLAGTINTAGTTHQPLGGQGAWLPRVVPIIDGKPNFSIGYAPPGRLRGRKVVLPGAAPPSGPPGRD